MTVVVGVSFGVGFLSFWRRRYLGGRVVHD